MAADEDMCQPASRGVALRHLVRVVIPSAPDAAVVRLLLGAAAAHPALRSQRDLQVLGEGQKRTNRAENPYTARAAELMRLARDVMN